MLNIFWENFFNSEKKDILKLIKNCPLFSDLSNRELSFIRKLLHKRNYIEGETVFKSDSGTGMYIIVKGRVNIFHGSVDAEGAQLVSVLKEGDFFGELALVQDKGYRNIFAQSAKNSQLLGFFQTDINQLIDHYPRTGVKILKKLCYILGHRLMKAEQKLLQSSHQSTENT